jgi:hypothetical protein
MANTTDIWFLKTDLASFARFVLAGHPVAQRRGFVEAIEEVGFTRICAMSEVLKSDNASTVRPKVLSLEKG